MTDFPSVVYGTGDQSLGALFPTKIPDPERYVYDYVREAVSNGGISFPDDLGVPLLLPTDFDLTAPLSLYSNREDAREIPVVRGWPAYPGEIPAIGVALGTESEDDQNEVESGGFAGTVVARDENGNVIGTADYYAEPIYATIVVELIHTNRDERDRLHNELRRTLFPLRRKLIDRDPLIRRVRVDAEKQELPVDEQPLTIYVSVFTVHVYYEWLEATDVTGADGIIESVESTVVPNDVADYTADELLENDVEVTT